jgi:hypothetical protein
MTNTTDDALRQLVAELVPVGGMFAQIVSHMEAFAASRPCDPERLPMEVVLEGMLEDILRPVFSGRNSSDLAVTTVLLKLIADTMQNELLLVSPDFVDAHMNPN